MSTDDSSRPQAGSSAALRRELLERRLRGQKVERNVVQEIPRVSRAQPLQMSYGQERFWFLDHLQPGSLEYLVPLVLRVRGALDEQVLRRALGEVVARHEVLRTRYVEKGGGPVQVIDAPAPLELACVDLRALTPKEREQRLTELIAAEGRRPFDLAAGPVLRAQWVRLARDEDAVLVMVHHVATDGWSMGVLARELDALYQAFASGRASPLPPLALQYADFAAWQRERLAGEVLGLQLEYWKQRLAGVEPLELATDRPRPSVRSPAGDMVSVEIRSEVGSKLLELGRAHGATPFMVLMAAFQALLHRYTGQVDISVGTPIAGRTRVEVEPLIGFFVNMLVMRADLSGDLSFSALLKQVRETALEAYAHQELPFEKLVDVLQPERDLSRNPLFQVVFALQSAVAVEQSQFGGFAAEVLPSPLQSSKFDLAMYLSEVGNGRLAGVIEYATALFDRSTVERLAGHYVRLLERIAEAPEIPLSRLDFLGEVERRALLTEWNDRSTQVPDRCLHELFEEQVRSAPDAVAVVSGDVRLTYAELNAQANRLAHHLRAQGVGPDALVGLCLQRSHQILVCILGVLKAGGAYVPIDPDHPRERQSFMLDDTGVRVVVTEAGLSDRLAGAGRRLIDLDRDRDAILAHSPEDPRGGARPENLAYVIYTSGSTGKPKGVMIPHSNVLQLFQAAVRDFELSSKDVWTLFHSYAFDFSVWEIWGALLYGGRVVVVPYGVSRSPHEFLRLLIEERVTVLSQTPSAFRTLVEAAREHAVTPEQLALRYVVFGGEALDVMALAPWLERFGDQAPRLVNMYGITETTVHVTYRALSRGDLAGVTRSPVGPPLAGWRLYILDAAMNPVPVGVPGEVYVGGAGLARGYLHRPELTATRFVPSPFSKEPGARLYRTGDKARFLAGNEVEFLGRLDNQVKVRGFRIELGEIEAALLEHPEVAAAVVLAQRSSAGDPYLVGYVVGKEPGSNLSGLRPYLGGKLPSYMVPAFIVPLKALPLTFNGKVDRKALPLPDRARSDQEREYVAPLTPREEQMASIWAEVLGLDQVGMQDSFFDLGGDSIRAVRLVGALRRHGINVSVQELFMHPTVAGLCSVDTRGRSSAAEELRVAPLELLTPADRRALPSGVEDAYPLSMVQAGMVYEMLADARRHLYHNITCYQIPDDGPFALQALSEAFQIIIQRHELLRSSFDLNAFSEPLQMVHREVTSEVGFRDLRGLDEAGQKAALNEHIAQVRANPLDIRQPPLLRLYAHQTAERTWWLSVVEHHAILDGWSHHSLVAEILACYRALREGHATEAWTPPATRFADFVALERQRLQSNEDRDFWASRVLTHDKLALPEAWASVDKSTAFYSIRVPYRDLLPGLRNMSRMSGVPLKSVMFAAHLKVLGMISGQRRFFTGLVSNGRLERQGGDQVRGMFLNSVPFAVSLDAPTWIDLARAVFAEEVELWPHRRYPLPVMQRQWGRDRPLLDIIFNYLDFSTLYRGELNPDGAMDVSPNEFALQVLTEPDALVLMAWERNIDREHGKLLGQLYREVLAAIAADPKGDARRSLLPEAERRRLLIEWNDTRAEVPERCIHEMFEEQVRATPEAVALVFGEAKLTYAQLEARANQLAHHLRALGVGPEARVGVCLERSLEMVISLLGTLKAGGAYVPLDPAYPQERLSWMLGDVRPTVVLTVEALKSKLSGQRSQVVCLDTGWAEVARRPETRPERLASADNLAYVIYTSGSTGRPKGAMNAHRAVFNRLWWMQKEYRLGAKDVVLQKTPFSFDVSVWEFFWPLMAGARLVVAKPGGHQEPDYLRALIIREGVTTLHFVPPMLKVFLEEPRLEKCTSIKRVVCSGEALSVELRDRCLERLPWVELHNLYGPTEAAVDVTYHPCRRGERLVPIGRPVANTQVRILDGHLEPAPVGVPGELYIGGVQVGRGYLERPELTAERFIPDAFSAVPGARLYRTGDLARWLPDGAIEYLGRVDFQVKLRGFRIELGEIESRLEQHPSVRQSVVVVREDVPGERRLVAYVVASSTGELEFGALRSWLRERLPEHMVPMVFVRIEALPLSPNGKLDRRALPAPEQEGPRSFAAPRTRVEQVLADLWAQVLRVKQVGLHDNFFDRGGDSLGALRVVAQARQAGLVLQIRQLIDNPTLEALAAVVSGVAATKGSTAAEETEAEDELPLIPSQQWLVETFDIEHHTWAVNLLWEVPPDFKPELLRASAAWLSEHRDVLRMRLVQTEKGWRARLLSSANDVPLEICELGGLESHAQQQAILERVARVQETVSIARGPVLTFVLFRLGGTRPDKLLACIHHSVYDHWALPILLEELLEAYQKLAAGERLHPPRATARYWQYMRAMRAYSRSPAMEADRAFWFDEARVRPVARLPVDFEGGQHTDLNTQRMSLALPPGLGLRMVKYTQLHRDVQLNDLLLFGFACAYARWSGGQDLYVDMEHNGRTGLLPQLDLTYTVGATSIKFPVRFSLRPDEAPTAAFEKVRRTLRETMPRGLGYGFLRYNQDEAVRKRLLAPGPVQVFFNNRRHASPSESEGGPQMENVVLPRADGVANPYSYDLMLECDGDGTELVMSWVYSRAIHRQETIRAVAEDYFAHLEALVRDV